MAFLNRSLVEETTTSSGTGQSITLNGKAAGRFSFADRGYSAGDTCNYVLVQGNDLEAGEGTFQGGTDFDRAINPDFSTNSNNRIDLDGSEARLFVAPLGERSLVRDNTQRYFDGDGNRVAQLFPQAEKSSDFTAQTDEEYPVDVSSNTVTVTLPGSPDNGDRVRVRDSNRNAGTNNITVDGNGKNIDGSSSISIDRNGGLGEFVFNTSDDEWHQILATDVLVNLDVDFQEFTSDGTWNKPSQAVQVIVEAIGGGGGGANATGAGPEGGGGGGGFTRRVFKASNVGSSETVTVGAGGSGGADGGDNVGAAGGDSSFGSLVTAFGGGGGGSGGGGNGGNYGGFGGNSPFNSEESGMPDAVSGGGGYDSRRGGDSLYGGAGGGSVTDAADAVGGQSEHGGDGGDGNASNSPGGDGSAPGGGGGASSNDGGGGDGARGRVRVWTLKAG